MQIICIDKNKHIQYYYKLYLESKYKAKVKNIFSHNEISAPELKKAKIILFLNDYNEKDYKFFINQKKAMKLNYKIISIYNKNKNFISFDEKKRSIELFNINKLNDELLKTSISQDLIGTHYHIPYEILNFIDKTPCSVYKKVDLYLDTILYQNSNVNIQKYKRNHLCIKLSDLEKFSSIFCKKVFKEYKSLIHKDNLLKFININYKKINNIGLNQKDINEVENKIDFILNIIKNEKEELFKLISEIFSKEFFISEHSLMLSYILAKMGSLYYKNEQGINDLIICALFHDLKLKIEDTHHEIEETNKVKYHCTEIIDSIKNLNFFSSNVENILLFHHELPNGKGLFNKENNEITNDCAFFIVGHSFVINLIKSNFNIDLSYKNTNLQFKNTGNPFNLALNLFNESISNII